MHTLAVPGERSLQKRIRMIVNGALYETLEATLSRFPNTLLGAKSKREEFLDPTRSAYCFQRNRECFDAILFYYQSRGTLARPPSVPMEEFVDECDFFLLEKRDVLKMREREGYLNTSPSKSEKRKKQKMTFCRRAWKFLDEPESSTSAKLYALFSMSLIVVSIALTCASSTPAIGSSRQKNLYQDMWFLLELTLNVFFAIEYTIRFTFSPRKLLFAIHILNLVDLCAFLPFFVALLVDASSISNFAFLRALRTVRVLRLLRLGKHSKTLELVIKIIVTCLYDMLNVFLCLLVVCIIGGAILYYVELGESRSQFTSIPQSMWWAVQTVVTLGYGDIIPSTAWGKLSASIVAIFGAVTLTIPLLSVGGKYVSIYNKTFSTNEKEVKVKKMGDHVFDAQTHPNRKVSRT